MKDHKAARRRLSALPSVHILLQNPVIRDLCVRHSRSRVVEGIRHVLQDMRTRILEDPDHSPILEDFNEDMLAQRIAEHMAAPPIRSFRPVINASGILFHEALGGTPLGEAARTAMADALGPVVRDKPCRHGEDRVSRCLRRITGAEAALAVHTAPAALWLAVDTFGRGREVVISRGQFGANGPIRLPDLFQRCGARIVEVGATNKTYLEDYRRAIREETGAIFVVRPSTYALRGFTRDVPVAQIVRLCEETGIPVVYDIGHATLTSAIHAGWRPPAVRDAVEAGVSVAVFGGDGLAGGPSCGLAAGQREAIDRMRRNPLYNILRIDTVTCAGLEAVLQQYDPEVSAFDQHPCGWIFTDTAETVRGRAERLLELCRTGLEDSGAFDLVETSAYLTSFRLPSESFPSFAVTVCPSGCDASAAAERLYRHSPAVLSTPVDDRVVLDLRSVEDGQIHQICRILESILKNTCAN